MTNSGTIEISESRWGGEKLNTTLRLLALPAFFCAPIILFDASLGGALYIAATLSCLPIVLKLFREPEPFLAMFLLYLPLCKLYVLPLAPGLNGTNLFELGLLLAWVSNKKGTDKLNSPRKPYSTLVQLWAVLSLLSFGTTLARIGLSEFLENYTDVLKAWLDQFVVFFLVRGLIRDKEMARRVVIYLMIGTLFVLALGFQEWLDKKDVNNMEKARLLGPQLQPNDFAAYLVYSSGPFIGLYASYWSKWRTWFMIPYLIVLARLILATFSRGAYIGMGLAALVTTYVRGKVLLIFAIGIVWGLISLAPSLIPESMQARLGQTSSETQADGTLDKSSETRLVLWKAAIEMTTESPVLGKGFGAFKILKSKYTERDVEESDNHNMFLYIASQMGIPALLVFLLLIWRTLIGGKRLYVSSAHPFDRAIGLGAVAIAGGIIGVNMFGSRMVDIVVSGYFWAYLGALSVLLTSNDVKANQSGRFL